MGSTAQLFVPPGGHTAGPDGAWSWFPLHLLLEHLGRCGTGGCTSPTAFIAIGTANREWCATACAEHACDIARLTDEHQTCPKCDVRWPAPADGLLAAVQAAIADAAC